MEAELKNFLEVKFGGLEGQIAVVNERLAKMEEKHDINSKETVENRLRIEQLCRELELARKTQGQCSQYCMSHRDEMKKADEKHQEEAKKENEEQTKALREYTDSKVLDMGKSLKIWILSGGAVLVLKVAYDIIKGAIK